MTHARDFYDGEGIRLLDDAAAGGKPVWIQIAKTGSFAGHASGPFELNDRVFREIVDNFEATSNRRIAVDFEHASEQGASSGSIPTQGAPAQGFVVDLKIVDGNLWGLVEWLEPARTYIREGRYPWVSPAIRFGTRDRVTGKPAGARLSSVALTTQPFLDGMQPVAAKDAGAATSLSLTGRTREYQIQGLPFDEASKRAAEELTATPAAEPSPDANLPSYIGTAELAEQIMAQTGASYTEAMIEASRRP